MRGIHVSARERQESEGKTNECSRDGKRVKGSQMSVRERPESEGKTNECTREGQESEGKTCENMREARE